MKRREFITLLGGAAVTWPFAAQVWLRLADRYQEDEEVRPAVQQQQQTQPKQDE